MIGGLGCFFSASGSPGPNVSADTSKLRALEDAALRDRVRHLEETRLAAELEAEEERYEAGKKTKP